ncbi:MAG: hypothetical protein ABIP51_23405 [Bacteroidia bacterium]
MRTFSSMEEIMFFTKEDFKKALPDLKDTIYYFPPITSNIPGDTTIVLFASCKIPNMCGGGAEYYIDRKKLKILWVERGQ